MSDFLPDPPRWRDGGRLPSATERAATEVVRQLATTAPLTQVELARIRRRLSAPRPAFPLRFWLTVTGALLLGGATAASAARLHLLPRWITGEAVTAPAELRRGASSSRSHRGSPSAPPAAAQPGSSPEVLPESARPAAAEPILTPAATRASNAPHPHHARTVASVEQPPAAVEPALRAPAPTLAPVPAPAPTQTAPVVPSPPTTIQSPRLLPGPAAGPFLVESPAAPPAKPALRGESGGSRRSDPAPLQQADDTSAKLLAQAIRTLRVGHAADRALAFLDAHDDELVRGGFGHEALLVRVEALLALQRAAEALRLLDETPLGNVAAGRSLRLTRAGLRAAADRCPEALADYEVLLATSGSHDERAVRGRENCRRKLAESQQPSRR